MFINKINNQFDELRRANNMHQWKGRPKVKQSLKEEGLHNISKDIFLNIIINFKYLPYWRSLCIIGEFRLQQYPKLRTDFDQRRFHK